MLVDALDSDSEASQACFGFGATLVLVDVFKQKSNKYLTQGEQPARKRRRMGDAAQSRSGLFNLPLPLLQLSLAHCCPRDLTAAAQTCHTLREACSYDRLWARLFWARLGVCYKRHCS